MNNQEALTKFHPVIDQRIQMAGVRIAHVLNTIFDERPIPQEGSELRRQLGLLLGPEHGRSISLEPVESFEVSFEASEFDCGEH
jgi:hypothetical protein